MKQYSIYIRLLSLTFLIVFFNSGCSSPPPPETEPSVRNVILIIGDGMGYPSAGLLRSYARYAPQSIYRGRNGISALEQAMMDGFNGLLYTEPWNVPVTDSAASGTQLATGEWTFAGIIGGDYHGNPVETVLQTAKRHGKSTGLVSDTRITHATPAAFAAHVPKRYMENTIAEQLIELEHRPDVMLSGGLRHFLPQSFNDHDSNIHHQLVSQRGIDTRIRSRRNDDRDLLAEAETEGYTITLTRNDLMQTQNTRVLGLFAGSAMPDAITETRMKRDPGRTWPTLSEMTQHALNTLDTNPNGFFLMIEPGQIDWAGHNNDAGLLLHEMIRLDRVIDTVRTWAEDRDDTVIIITSDHDTGGFALTYTVLKETPEPIPLDGSLFADMDYVPNNDYGDYGVLDTLYNQSCGCFELFSRFRRLRSHEQTPGRLANLVSECMGIQLTYDDAERILHTRPNPYLLEDDQEDSFTPLYVPNMGDDQPFYTSQTSMLCGLLARRTGIEWNIAWATGTHTASPVPLIVLGPPHAIERFSPVMHSTDIGQVMRILVSE
jgi:alkaline phosphatase